MELETIIMELVVNGGNARSLALEAVEAASQKNFGLAKEKLEACDEALRRAHEFQTDMISAEAGGEGTVPVSLVLVHGQDHLMNAMTVRDLSEQMVRMYSIMFQK